MRTRGSIVGGALACALFAGASLNGCSFITIGAGVAAALGGGGGGGSSDGPSAGPWTGPPWQFHRALPQGRMGATATLMHSGLVLVAGGDDGTGNLASCEMYDAEQDWWFSTSGSMGTARRDHCAVALDNGKVLVFGGTGGRAAEWYDPAADTWASLGLTGGTYSWGTGTLLNNGMVLLVGQNPGMGTELFDPTTSSFFATFGSMSTQRGRHAAVLLQNGDVLVAGGGTATTEIYNPIADSWSTTGSMSRSVFDLTLTVLRDGRVLAVGGYDQSQTNQVATCEIYNPATSTWTSAATMFNRRGWHTATLMTDGNVLVTGGAGIPNGDNGSPGPSFTAELYDTFLDQWMPYGTLRSERRSDHRAVMLLTGNLLVLGGVSSGGTAIASTESPVRSVGLTSTAVATQTPRSAHRAVSVGALNQILVAGGWNGTSMQSSCELIDPVAGTRSGTGAMGTTRNRFIMIQLASGDVLAAGGWNGSAVTSASERYSPAIGTWTGTLGSMVTARQEALAVLLKDGRVLCAGGLGASSSVLSVTEIFDPVLDTWSSANSMATARYHHTMNRLYNGQVFVCGGWNGTTTYSSAELYDPTTGSWSAAATMPSPRRHHTATTLPDGSILVAGGRNNGGFTQATADIYYPWSDSWATGAAAPPNMPGTRREHTAVQQLDGRIAVFGGWNTSGVRQAAPLLYDFQTNTWASVGGVTTTPREEHVMVMHRSEVIINGGETGSASSPTFLSSTERIEDHRNGVSPRPVITAVGGLSTQPVFLTRGNTVTVSGFGFRSPGEGSGGTNGSSASDLPVITLTGPVGGASGRNLHGDPQVWRELVTQFSSGFTVDFVAPPAASNVGAGIYALRVTVNGVPSDPFFVSVP